MRTILQGFLLTLTMLACKEAVEKKRYKPASSGNINSLLVVMDNDLWQGRVGDAVRLNIGSEVSGLPQKEVYFDFNQVPSAVFSDFVRLNRIILKVQISEKIGAAYYKNPYANPQSMVVISAPDRESLIDIIAKEAPEIISKFKSYEFQEKQRRINKSLLNSEKIQTALDIRVRLPSVYRIAKSEKDFFWIRKDTKTGSLNLLLYTLNENKLNSSKSFDLTSSEKSRNVILGKEVGPIYSATTSDIISTIDKITDQVSDIEIEFESKLDKLEIENSNLRNQVISLKNENHKTIEQTSDFYSMSMLRDLLFHVQEHQFTIPQIKDGLADLGLFFCGFKTEHNLQYFKSRGLSKSAVYDLDKWDKFEKANPHTFGSMYQFWCQKIN